MDSSNVLEIFKSITKIPRESGFEEPMTKFLQQFAKDRNLECKTDKIGNVCITKPASKGKENVPTLVLQGHQDMVCEKKNGSTHDFLKDPIEYVIEDGWMIAKDTTLGADDGIGDAAMLALLDADLPTGKLECVFTISEETGMDGAFGMEPGFFTGRTLINLDSEDEGQMFIGCAGGLDTFAKFTYEPESRRSGYRVIKLQIGNALGGHSGDDINKERINTIQQMARFLYTEIDSDYQLITFKGGNKPNAIARDCEAVIAVPESHAEDVVARFKAFGETVVKEYFKTDSSVEFHASPVCSEKECKASKKLGILSVEIEASISDYTDQAISGEVTKKLIAALFACPHGVQAMSQDIPGLVQVSTNLAAVKMQNPGEIEIVTSQRSAVPSERKMVAAKVEACFKLAGAEVKHDLEYPGWNPNTDSHILKVCVDSYKKLFGNDPEVKAIHAGLECGLFGERFGDLDMISFGPTLRGVHAPGEKLELASLDKFTEHLIDVVTNFE